MAIKYDSNFTEGDLLPSSVVNNIIDSIKENETNINKKMDKADMHVQYVKSTNESPVYLKNLNTSKNEETKLYILDGKFLLTDKISDVVIFDKAYAIITYDSVDDITMCYAYYYSCLEMIKFNYNELLSKKTIDISDLDKEIPNASKTIAGVVKVGDHINVTDGVISVPLARLDEAGVVKVQHGVESVGLQLDNDGNLSVDPATSFEQRIGNEVITVSNLNEAVKSAISGSARIEYMNSEERYKAKKLFGVCLSEFNSGSTTISINIPSEQEDKIILTDTAITKIDFLISGFPTVLYENSIVFTSGDTATTISVPDGFTFVGVDCDKDGAFIPSKNTNYEVHIQNISPVEGKYQFVGRVGVF